VKEETAVKMAIAWFWFMLLVGVGLTGLGVWGAVEIIQWIARH